MDDVVFVGPRPLRPLWRLYGWWTDRWITHDCNKQPVTCRLPSGLFLGWVDREKWTRWTDEEEQKPQP